MVDLTPSFVRLFPLPCLRVGDPGSIISNDSPLVCHTAFNYFATMSVSLPVRRVNLRRAVHILLGE